MFFMPGLQTAAALFISMGTLGMLVATGMIVGPKKQLASMAKPQRAGCAAAFVFFFIASWVLSSSSTSTPSTLRWVG